MRFGVAGHESEAGASSTFLNQELAAGWSPHRIAYHDGPLQQAPHPHGPETRWSGLWQRHPHAQGQHHE